MDLVLRYLTSYTQVYPVIVFDSLIFDGSDNINIVQYVPVQSDLLRRKVCK